MSRAHEAERGVLELSQQVPLAAHWSAAECHLEAVAIDGLELCLVGLVCSNTRGGDVTGSAAEVSRYPWRRAYFELVERAALLDALEEQANSYPLWDMQENRVGELPAAEVFPVAPAGSFWAYARSNGVAAGPDWASACSSARAELLERHAVLSSWYGLSKPERLEIEQDEALAALAARYEFEAYEFPLSLSTALSGSLRVVGLLGFPRSLADPLLHGFGAAPSLSAASARARAECLQRLGFLWGEAIPEQQPPLEATALYHQELYLWPAMHATLRGWLSGQHLGRASLLRTAPEGAPRFVDLTPPHLTDRVRVVKALPGTELPLTFGQGHPRISESAAALLGAHPIA